MALKILELTESYEIESLKKNYRKLALINHPDKGGNVETMQKINEAYSFLYLYDKHEELRDNELDELFKGTMAERTFANRNTFERLIVEPKVREIMLKKNILKNSEKNLTDRNEI